MASSIASFYGSCRNVPDFLLQPMGEGWKFPQWHIDFLTGMAPKGKSLNRIARKFLEALTDGKWHRKLPREVGVGTIEACVHLKLAKVQLVPDKDEPGTSWGEYKLTEEGGQVLKKNCLLPQFAN